MYTLFSVQCPQDSVRIAAIRTNKSPFSYIASQYAVITCKSVSQRCKFISKSNAVRSFSQIRAQTLSYRTNLMFLAHLVGRELKPRESTSRVFLPHKRARWLARERRNNERVVMAPANIHVCTIFQLYTDIHIFVPLILYRYVIPFLNFSMMPITDIYIFSAR